MDSPLIFFKCLADDTRLKSLLLLNRYSEACVCDLMAALELDQPKISRHLAELRKYGVVQDERRGKWVYYRLHPNLPDWAKEILVQTANASSGYMREAVEQFNAGNDVASCRV